MKEVVCNQCGKALSVENGILQEGCFSVDYLFDYFSNKDGYVYSMDICESCFDLWVKGFKKTVSIREIKEFL